MTQNTGVLCYVGMGFDILWVFLWDVKHYKKHNYIFHFTWDRCSEEQFVEPVVRRCSNFMQYHSQAASAKLDRFPASLPAASGLVKLTTAKRASTYSGDRSFCHTTLPPVYINISYNWFNYSSLHLHFTFNLWKRLMNGVNGPWTGWDKHCVSSLKLWMPSCRVHWKIKSERDIAGKRRPVSSPGLDWRSRSTIVACCIPVRLNVCELFCAVFWTWWCLAQ